ncbi:hypothetical protein M1843_15440 [Isoptericola sp. 4D.3]|uniref:Small CPxCG-related zinc finger protein n=1 Tax=Isoptericola peretonis TaxID=2918523 RepID=A0ABT0J6L2_9MICO|nr:hypothetical protein [Isoptericola sp. 4D.3]
MSDEKWDDIFRQVRDGDNGPWLCPVCDVDDPTVELGQRFTRGRVVASKLYCMACTAQAEVPVP